MKVFKNYIYNVGYQVLVLIIPLITVPYVSRVLGPTGVGINSYTSSIATYFVLVGSLGLNMYGIRTIAFVRDDKYKLSKCFWELMILRCITLGVSIICYLIYIDNFNNQYRIFFLGQFFLLTAAVFDISWFFMGLEDFKKTVIRNTIVKIFSLIMIFVFVKSKEDVFVYILILNVSTTLGNVTFWPYLKSIIIKVPTNELSLKKHLKPSIQLFIPQIALQIYLVLNKTMLGSLESIESAGYFENSDRLIKIVLSIVTASGIVMSPRVSNSFIKGEVDKVKRYLTLSLDFSTAISIPCMFGLMAIAKPFAPIFFGSEFSGIDKLIVILSPIIVLIAWSNTIGNQYLLPTSMLSTFTNSILFGTLINFIFNLVLIPSIGVLGAGIATVISELIITIIQIYSIRKELSISSISKNISKYILAGLLMYIILFFIRNQLNGSMLSILFLIIIGGIVYLLFVILLKPTSLSYLKQITNKKNGMR